MLEFLQLLKRTGQRTLVNLGFHGMVVHLGLKPKLLQLHIRPQTGEEMVALSADGLGWRLRETRVTLQGLVIDFDFPPFLIDCLHPRGI